MKQENETVKIKTKQGRIVTLTITTQTDSYVFGKDKFDRSTLIRFEDIETMLPYVPVVGGSV